MENLDLSGQISVERFKDCTLLFGIKGNCCDNCCLYSGFKAVGHQYTCSCLLEMTDVKMEDEAVHNH